MCVAAVQLGIKATRHTLHSWLKSFLSMRKRDCVFVFVILLQTRTRLGLNLFGVGGTKLRGRQATDISVPAGMLVCQQVLVQRTPAPSIQTAN